MPESSLMSGRRFDLTVESRVDQNELIESIDGDLSLDPVMTAAIAVTRSSHDSDAAAQIKTKHFSTNLIFSFNLFCNFTQGW